MAFFDSEVSVFQMTDTGAALRDVSPGIVDIGGLPGTRGLNDVTALGDGARRWSPGLEDVTINLGCIYTDTALVGIDTVFGPLRADTTPRAWDYGPEGKGTGAPKYSGNAFVESYEIQSRVGNRVEATVVLKVDGKITVGTYA